MKDLTGRWVLRIAFLGLLAAGSLSLGAEEPDPVKTTPQTAPELMEFTGSIGKERASPWFRHWSRDEVLVLFTANGSFTLLRGRNKLVVAQIEAYLGKRLTITGILVPASQRHPRPGLKVYSFQEAPTVPAASDAFRLPSAPPLPEEKP